MRFPIDLPLGRTLHDKLCDGITKVEEARFYAAQAGIDPAEIQWNQILKLVWFQILDTAARARRLAALLEVLLADQMLGAIHEVIRQVKAAGAASADGQASVDVCGSLLPSVTSNTIRCVPGPRLTLSVGVEVSSPSENSPSSNH